MRLCLPALLFAAACHKAPPAALPDPQGPRTYKIGVATAQGEAVATSITTLRVIPRDEDTFAFLTERSEGSWEKGEVAMTFDSDRPRASDPWPITLQHAVATVPAPIRVDLSSGALIEVEQQEAWRAAAREAVKAADLPDEAMLSAEQLLDPEGLLEDLRRNFPGMPARDLTWVRNESIAGVAARRIETCTRTAEGKLTVFTCRGRLEGPVEGKARLVEGTSVSVLRLDRRGLVDLDLTHEATLVVLSPDGRRALDRPVVGRRKVVRQD